MGRFQIGFNKVRQSLVTRVKDLVQTGICQVSRDGSEEVGCRTSVACGLWEELGLLRAEALAVWSAWFFPLEKAELFLWCGLQW